MGYSWIISSWLIIIFASYVIFFVSISMTVNDVRYWKHHDYDSFRFKYPTEAGSHSLPRWQTIRDSPSIEADEGGDITDVDLLGGTDPCTGTVRWFSLLLTLWLCCWWSASFLPVKWLNLKGEKREILQITVNFALKIQTRNTFESFGLED